MTSNIDTNHSLLLDSRARLEQRSSLSQRCANEWLVSGCYAYRSVCEESLDEERIEIIVSHARTYPPVAQLIK